MSEGTTDTLTLQQAEGLYSNMEMLASDQLRTESAVQKLERNQKLLAGGVVVSLASVVVIYQVVGKMMRGLNQMGQMVLAMSGDKGMPPQAEAKQPPPRQNGTAKVVVEPRQGWAPPEPDLENKGGPDGWDPGPQELPEEMRRAIMDDDLTSRVMGDDEGTTDFDRLLGEEPVETPDSPRVRHNADKGRNERR